MADLVIERSLPSERAAEILDLFDRAAQPEFPAVFEQAYKPRERSGLRSWIGFSGDKAVLHIAVTPQQLSDGSRSLTLGLLGDLMADETQRNFWGPLKLARQMVADVRKDRSADLLLTTFVPAAESVFKACGFRPFTAMRRFVLPLQWPYPLLRRLQHGERRPAVTAIPWGDEGVYRLLGDLTSPDTLRPVVSRDYFTTRMPRLAFAAGAWLLAGAPGSPDAVALVAPKPNRELAIADLLWRDVGTPLAGVLSSVARWAARSGYRRVSLTTLPGSRLSVEAQRAGFLMRPDDYALLMLPICAPELIPPHDRWSFTNFVLTSW